MNRDMFNLAKGWWWYGGGILELIDFLDSDLTYFDHQDGNSISVKNLGK